ncbi:Voltage-dependent T-type calcium channel subunit alpha-1H, partial [Araneus ventricosus]
MNQQLRDVSSLSNQSRNILTAILCIRSKHAMCVRLNQESNLRLFERRGIAASDSPILTQEDWNIVLFNGMERTSHWAALYFVALMTFGNYVLFNLLVAILVEGFSAEDERKRSDESINHEEEHKQVKKTSRKESQSSRHGHHHHPRYSQDQGEGSHFSPPLITHTAATPQGSPNNTLEPLMRDLKDRLTPLMAFNVPGQSFESIDKTSV